jgi:hypothetical protein
MEGMPFAFAPFSLLTQHSINHQSSRINITYFAYPNTTEH